MRTGVDNAPAEPANAKEPPPKELGAPPASPLPLGPVFLTALGKSLSCLEGAVPLYSQKAFLSGPPLLPNNTGKGFLPRTQGALKSPFESAPSGFLRTSPVPWMAQPGTDPASTSCATEQKHLTPTLERLKDTLPSLATLFFHLCAVHMCLLLFFSLILTSDFCKKGGVGMLFQYKWHPVLSPHAFSAVCPRRSLITDPAWRWCVTHLLGIFVVYGISICVGLWKYEERWDPRKRLAALPQSHCLGVWGMQHLKKKTHFSLIESRLIESLTCRGCQIWYSQTRESDYILLTDRTIVVEKA